MASNIRTFDWEAEPTAEQRRGLVKQDAKNEAESLARPSQVRNRFARRSGCYICDMCHKRTRDTGNDEAAVRLCAACYKICGEENQAQDTP